MAFLAGPQASRSGRQRAIGYRDALAAVSLPHEPARIIHCSPTVAGGYMTVRALLSLHPELTGLFCYNDLVAVGALQACAELGRSVPEEVAVVGFDDIPLAALVTPPLTTCHVPRYELGAEAVRLLLDQIDGCPEGCAEVVLMPELLIRASAPETRLEER